MNSRKLTYLLIAVMLLGSCSTVSRLPEGELLYTGTRSIEVTDAPDSPLRDKAIAEAKVAFVSPPNNALLGSSRYRIPLPIGLWAYNAFVDDSTGLRRWIFKTFASQPILISTVNPKFRAEVAKNTLRNYGYFGSDVTYHIDTLKSPKKAELSYTMQLGTPIRYGQVEYRGFTASMDSLVRATSAGRLLRQGDQLSYTTLSGERNRLFSLFRQHGYYYFRPDMITILADTTLHKGQAQLRIEPRGALPAYVTRPWHIGHTYLAVRNEPNELLTDTLSTPFFTYLYTGKHTPIRQALVRSRLRHLRGSTYSPAEQDATQRELNRLGIFNGVSINYIPRDSISKSDTLDVYISTLLEPPYEFSLETNFTAKSNDQIGPGAVIGLSRKNLFRMAEVIQLRLKGSYEWQTNRALRREGSVVNSFELGADISMSVPQLLFPGGYHYHYHHPVSTTSRLYVDWLNRGGFFRMLAFGGNLTYAFSSSDYLTHSVTPFRLTFNTLEKTTHRFDSVMTANPIIGLSFRDQFIPALSYTATYDNSALRDNSIPGIYNTSKLTVSLTSAGAATSLVYAATGHKLSERGKTLLSTPFAQFIKGSVEACRYYHLPARHTLATRLIAGAVYAYGNSRVAPFSEQFYVGGANDLRAFPLRGIGPGSYHSSGRYAYIDHTGDLKLEANIEWRFPLLAQLNGALFVDAGNVWLLRHDEVRPGAQFRWNTLGRDLALGTGIGLRYNLRILVLRADMGIPIHIPYATGKRGYYNVPHFGKGLCFHFAVGYPF
ncbi:MAG: BamA/TamA family outer membrane protein [Bacteroidaceae bacterium]|nr:BamA/TamA family outer membrane protein [Bacteroidaceae bacterium]